ncbi:MAG: GNAT family N-acetyltransferase [Oceanicaulis sp.]
MNAPELRTDRLILRETRLQDFEPCAALWGDERVVRHIGGRVSSPSESWARMLRFPGLWALLGYGYWTLVDRETGRFCGQAGLADFKRELSVDITGVPEAGWVLSPAVHGRGYATEAMTAILGWADGALDDPETCCIIDPENTASLNVARKLGYAHAEDASLGGAATIVLWRPKGG